MKSSLCITASATLLLFPACKNTENAITEPMHAHCEAARDDWYRIEGIEAIHQPTPMSCWCAVAAMMLSWKEQRHVSIDEFVARNILWGILFDADAGLTNEDFKLLVFELGLTVHRPQNFMLQAYRQMLVDHGPVWIIAASDDGLASHARILVGYAGDTTRESSKTLESVCLELIDPATGEYVREDAVSFLSNFEREASLTYKWPGELRLQVAHW